MPDFLNTGPADAASRLLLAHGAGAPMTSPFMETICALLAERGVSVTRFEFSYMAARRNGGKRRPPPKAETLMGEFEAAIAEARALTGSQQRLFIGGKSLGGRVASMIADTAFGSGSIRGLVCLGYPFHPPGKPDQLRTAHLAQLACPTLIIQGERDPFGSRSEVEAMSLSKAIDFLWAVDGDHDLGPRGASGFTRKGNLTAAADTIADFMGRIGKE
ncbi:MAG: alpha/beta family hydrolase [Hyphomicrobiaceae bacterium]